jgi:acyl-CoA dehydrogenase
MTTLLVALGVLAVLGALAYHRASLITWTVAVGLLLAGYGFATDTTPTFGWFLFVVLALALNFRPLRRRLVSDRLLGWFRSVLPPMSDTERIAIEAGTVWWDKELFSGRPDWQKLVDYAKPELSPEEQAFIDGPVEELCKMLDDWKITAELNDLPKEAWDHIKKHRFFGMIVPKEYGGLEFSALANSTVVMKLSTKSGSAGVTVMVPNSLGPAELLVHYGTQAQRDHYLPKLARGEEIPCFALTSPWAGSDAGAIPDTAIVCKGTWKGKEVVGLRVSWDKRYITLAPVATVLGLAVRAYDPDRLLGDRHDLGITCLLLPTDTPGVEIGARHAPLNAAFMNGTTRGKDVFVPMDYVIGGQPMLGKGWMMLMNCLSAGRAISLPALGTGAGKLAARMTGAYARVRKQFRTPIGKFEGVEEALARIAAHTYRMDAARMLTAAAIDQGEKPSVLSAILKYHCTEGYRRTINDAMDIHGGRGVIMGPSNYLARPYQAIPVSITVEGANILTRSMIIFGQGAIRCHPFLLAEMEAAADKDAERGAIEFDRALFAHVGFTISNAVRALWMGLTGARFVSVPESGHPAEQYYRQFTRMSAAFAFVADVGLLLLGGEMKRKEKLSARYGDILSHLYMGSAMLKRWEDTGRPGDDAPLLEWACQESLAIIQERMEEILRNFPSSLLGSILKRMVLPYGRSYRMPSDRLGHAAASVLLAPGEARDRLTRGAYVSRDPQDICGRMEHALELTLRMEPIEAKIYKELKLRITPNNFDEVIAKALAAHVIEESQARLLREAQAAIFKAISVDEFEPAAGAAASMPRAINQ